MDLYSEPGLAKARNSKTGFVVPLYMERGVRGPAGTAARLVFSITGGGYIALYMLNMGRYTAMRMNTTKMASATMMAGSSRLSARFTRTSTSLS